MTALGVIAPVVGLQTRTLTVLVALTHDDQLKLVLPNEAAGEKNVALPAVALPTVSVCSWQVCAEMEVNVKV